MNLIKKRFLIIIFGLVATGLLIHISQANSLPTLKSEHAASDTDTANLLILAGAPIDLNDAKGNTPLLKYTSNAVGLGYYDQERIKIAKLLMAAGANPHIKDRGGITSIEYAIRGGHNDFIKSIPEYNKCSWRRPFERDVTGLSDDKIIDQVVNGFRRTCTR